MEDQRVWQCSVCTLKNNHFRNKCEVCDNPRSTSGFGVTSDSGCTDDSASDTNYGAYGWNNTHSGPEAEELRIVLIGKTGTGKSATGNTILGKKAFESKLCGSSITKKCKLGMGVRFGRKIVIVDTPGLYDTGMTNEAVTREIVKCIGITAPGPHAVLLTVNIGRFTKEEQDTVKHFVDHFGTGLYNYMMVVFTRSDELEAENVPIAEYVRNAPPELKVVLQLCRQRYVPFNNKLVGQRQDHQVTDLISRIDDVVATNGGCCYTNEMYQEAEATLKRREQEVRRKLEEEKKRAVENIKRQIESQYNVKFAKEQEEREKLEKTIKNIEKDREAAQGRESAINREVEELTNQLQVCRSKVDERNTENEKRLEDTIKELERKQADENRMREARDKDEQVAQLQRQMAESEERQKKEREELKKEMDRKIQEQEEKYRKLTEQPALRDNTRRECEEEKDVFGQLWGGIKAAVSTVVPFVKSCVIS